MLANRKKSKIDNDRLDVNKKDRILTKWILRTILIVATILVVVPLVWTILSSFKTTQEFYKSPWALPEALHFDNYINAFTKASMGSYFLNSIFVTILSLIILLVLCVPAAYVLARYKFWGSNFIKALFMGGLFIQPVYIIVPLFMLLKDLNMLDSLISISIIYAVLHLPFSIYILTGFFKSVAIDYEEAAMIDGCSNIKILTKIVVPLAKPGIITVTIFNFMAFWNEYALASVFLMSPEKKTLPVGLQLLMEVQKFATDWGALFAGLVIVMIPSMLIYTLLHKKLTEGVNIGGIKG